MLSLGRAACRLLSIPAASSIRPRLATVSNAHRLVIPRRTFLQTRWVGDEVKSQLDTKAAATTTTTTKTATTNEVPESEVKVEAETAKVEEVVTQDSEAVLDTAALINAPETSIEDEIKVEKIGEVVEQDSKASLDISDSTSTVNTTTTTTTTDNERDPTIDGVLSQIRDAADQEPEAPTEELDEPKRFKSKAALRTRKITPKETVYIGNLFYDVTVEDLKEQMSKFGVVEQANIVYDARGISKGFGYVQFDTLDAAKRAIEAMNMRIFEGRRVVLDYAQYRLNRDRKLATPTKTLYIGNAPYDMTDRDLQALFKDVVNAIDVRVSVDRKTGQPRGWFHAEFTDVESAAAGLEILSRKLIHGRKLRVDFAISNRTAEKVSPIAE